MLRIDHISKQFGPVVALDNVGLHVRPGEIVTLVGTSGCGKSTLLRIVAGLDVPTKGRVLINEEPITAPHPAVGVIFQEPRLMPWLTVRQNVRFGIANLPDAEQEQRTTAVLERVGLTAFADALPRQLSGGMAQRVAIARALVAQPSLLLLDEPFSALDPFTKMKLQDHLLEIWSYDRPTLLLVTHDIEEALVLSDRVVVLRGHPGRIHQTLSVDLPRPRRRTDPDFQQWKQRLLDALDVTTDEPLLAHHA
ncbi:ABC transporter ATP-binding protein [Hymenobacter tibetensis]|uniref:ABC transporter ATP-binding protein n=1 Tax=Hymenobacter tibetensis TaxID=497967 RepID=A0ABY4CXE6_9BACT|nr:ABC transporter ATP-binding protein [Hymenobacter tibetensis]UOG74427.1 ABC transporter ATP-binding protein [Hymenobacter tibetensis]